MWIGNDNELTVTFKVTVSFQLRKSIYLTSPNRQITIPVNARYFLSPNSRIQFHHRNQILQRDHPVKNPYYNILWLQNNSQ